MSLTAAILEVHHWLDSRGVSHAFGGALALAQYAEPRATVDIDVNAFVPDSDRDELVESLAALGYQPEPELAPLAGLRLRRSTDPYPLDLFVALSPVYAEIARRVRQLPFGPELVDLPFLSAEDLVVFKLSFGRDKDWVDIRQIFRAGVVLDVEYVERQLIELRGPTMYPRVVRLRSLSD
jgi:hypothetical protein